MQALIHGYNTQAVITANKTMVPLQQFVFLSQSKIEMNEERGVGERVNGDREHKERCEPPKQPKYGFKYLLENQEPHVLSPRSTCNHFSPLKQ
jgi:hypothetical protein